MKLTTLLLALSLPLLNSCGDKKDDHAHDHDDHSHGDHSHGKDGHGKDGHGKDGHGKDGHDHDKGGHSHDKVDADHKDHDHSNPDHDHSHCNVQVGPNGGRLIAGEHLNAEFNVNNEGKITLTFLSKEGKPAEHAEKTIILVNNKPVKTTTEGGVISTGVIDFSKPAKVIVNIDEHGHGDEAAHGHETEEHFTVEKGDCTKCKNKKYSCTCDNHDHDH